MLSIKRTLAAAVAGTFAFAVLTGCSTETASDSSQIAEGEATAGATQSPLQFQDMWVKATDSDMTAVFGTITNTGTEPVTLESATFDGAGTTEFHETMVQSDGSSVMQQMSVLPTIEPGDSWVLEPGHEHIMLMKLDAPIEPSQTNTLTITLADGSTHETEVTAREYTGGQETYAPEEDHGGDDHGDH